MRESMIDPSMLRDEYRLRHGVCSSCMALVKEGHTIIIAEPDTANDPRPPRSAVLSLEGTATLAEEARGKIIRVPMDEYLKRFKA